MLIIIKNDNNNDDTYYIQWNILIYNKYKTIF